MTDPDTIHIVPCDDLYEHITDTDVDDCWCLPVTQPVEREDGSFGWLLVHNAADGRADD